MPIAKIRLEDGRIARFNVPEGTSEDEVLEMVKPLLGNLGVDNKEPAQEKSAITDTLDTLSDFSSSFILGTAKLPLGAMQFASAALATEFPESESVEEFRQAARGAAKRLERGIEKIGERSPVASEVGSTAAEIGQLAPIGAGASTLPKLAVAGAGGAGTAGVLSPVTEDLTPQQQLMRQGKQGITNAAIGAVAAPLVKTSVEGVKRLPGAVSKVASKIANINPAAVDDLQSAGIQNSLAVVSDSPSIKLYDRFLSKFPGASGVMKRDTDEVIGQLERTVEKAGGSKGVSIQEAGEVIQKGGRNFVERFKSASEVLYGRLDRKIPKDAQAAVKNTLALADDVQFSDDIFGKEAKGIINAIAGRSQGELTRQQMGLAGSKVVGAGEIPYSQLRKFRTLVGNKLSKSYLLGGEDEAALKRLYGALSEDMKVAAEKAGALKEFKQANDFFSKHSEFIKEDLQKVIQKRAPEQVFQAATSGTKLGGTKINQVMRSLRPSEREIVRGTVIKKLGELPAGQQGAEGGVFSANRFLTNWNNLTPEAKKAFFGSDTASRNALNNVARISERIKDIDRFGNPSGTAQQITMGALLVGGAVEPMSVATGIAGANGSARLMTSDAFVKWLSKHSGKRLTEGTLNSAMKELKGVAKVDPTIVDDLARYTAILGGLSDDSSD